jgi:hypothetical protein
MSQVGSVLTETDKQIGRLLKKLYELNLKEPVQKASF